MSDTFEVSFAEGAFSPVKVPRGAHVSLHLTVQNSPVLFGCRTGLCGTCAAEIELLSGTMAPPDEEEKETLELAYDGPPPPAARLLCQLRLTGDVRIVRAKAWETTT